MNTRMIRVNEKTHRFLKGLAGLNGTTLSEMIEKVVSFWTEKNQGSEDCKLCQKYGHEPNEATRHVLEASMRGEGLSEPMSGEDFLKKMDKEYGQN
ncbi:MAG: hypothetical protein WA705_26320 [Candidatus Ozemobacteraceae bacterium]